MEEKQELAQLAPEQKAPPVFAPSSLENGNRDARPGFPDFLAGRHGEHIMNFLQDAFPIPFCWPRLWKTLIANI